MLLNPKQIANAFGRLQNWQKVWNTRHSKTWNKTFPNNLDGVKNIKKGWIRRTQPLIRR